MPEKTIAEATGMPSLSFTLFPAFAKFIREHHLMEYIQEQVQLCREYNLPLLKYFSHLTDEQIVEMGIPSHTEFLDSIENNRLKEYLEKTIKSWEDDQLGIISKNDIAAEDITVGTYIRKTVLQRFLPLYASDPMEIIALVNEIDRYAVANNTLSINAYLRILRGSIKVHEIELKRSEDQLLEAQELANMGSFIWSIDTDELQVTPQFKKIYEMDSNFTVEAIKHIHPADIDKITTSRAKAIEENGIYDVEYRYLINNKEKIIWTKGQVYHENGEKMMRGTVMDITERKHIIQTLQRNERLYKQAQAMAHIGSWTWDLRLNKIEWSDELYRIYEMEPGTEILPDDLRKMNHQDDIERVAMVMEEAKQTLEPYDFHYRIVLPNGKMKIVHATGNVWADHDRKPFKLSGSVQDVTERQQMIDMLQKSEERYKQAQAMAHIGNWEWHIADNKIEWTDELYRIYGLDPADGPITYQQYIALLHPDEKEFMEATVKNCIEHRRPYDVVHRIVLKTGVVKYLRGIGNVITDTEGNAVMLFGTSQDITLQQEAEIAMQQKNIELAHSNASLEEFAYVASHDLKEPLRKIATFGDLMMNTDKDRLSPEGKNYMDKIISASRRMQTMINDLMALSTISGNKSFEPYDLNEILNEVANVLEHSIRENNVTITHDKLPTLRIVPSQFRQLFQNLLSNSIKFSRPDTPPVINITFSWISANEAAQYGLTEPKQHLKIMFTDNGIGFENEYAGKIFTIFQRLHGKSEYEGNGIGLSICKKVAENHKGTINAKSAPGEGATFTLIIPGL